MAVPAVGEGRRVMRKRGFSELSNSAVRLELTSSFRAIGRAKRDRHAEEPQEASVNVQPELVDSARIRGSICDVRANFDRKTDEIGHSRYSQSI